MAWRVVCVRAQRLSLVFNGFPQWRYGVEAQFYQNEEFLYSRRFELWEEAVRWAEVERVELEKDWT
jgi:hypothetical protein